MITLNTSYPDRSTLVNNYATKKSFFLGKLTGGNRDSFSFSAAGMRLNILFNGEKIESATVRTWEPMVGSGVKNEALKKLDRHIAQTGKTLEQMVELAEAAQNPELSDYERILMQIQLGQLQHDMDSANHRMGSARGGDFKPSMAELRGPYEDTNSYRMLTRALDRISNGREWNVAEIRNTILETQTGSIGSVDDGWLRAMYSGPLKIYGTPGEEPDAYGDVRKLYDTENGWIEYLKQQRPEWNNVDVYFEKPSGDPWGMFGGMRADDENPTLKALGYVWEVTNDKRVPTVGDILKGSGRSLMDPEAAVITAEELKKELKGLEKQREQLLHLAAQYAEVQNESNDSEKKQAVLERIGNFAIATFPDFLCSLYRESFQFTYGKKCNVFGKTKEEFEADMRPTDEIQPPLDLDNPPDWERPEVLSGEIRIPDKRAE